MRTSLTLLALTLSLTLVAGPRRQPAPQTVHTHLGIGYTLRSLCGIALTGGGSYKQHEAELQLTIGLQSSAQVHWYDDTGVWLSTMTYKQHSIALRYGYVVSAWRIATLTPQASLAIHMLTEQGGEGSKSYAASAMASTAAIGLRVAVPVSPNVNITLTPHYAITLSQDARFRGASRTAGFSAGGFGLTVGAMIDM